jgi:hypothetical protein
MWLPVVAAMLGIKMVQDYDAQQKQDRAIDKAKKANKAREDALAEEERARVAARKEAETLGRRAGTGGGGASSLRSTFLSTSRGGGSATGFGGGIGGDGGEDRMGRATLFGN